MKKMRFTPFIALILALFFLFAPLVGEQPAYAAEALQEQAQGEEKDLQQAKLLLFLHALTPLNDEANAAETTQELMEAYAKTDRWARYFNPAEFKEYTLSHEGSMVGIGIRYDVREGSVYVMDLIPGSPAARSDLQPGDIITKIDDIPLAGKTREEIQMQFRGEENTPVVLEIRRGETTYTEIMIRTIIDVISVEHELLSSGMGHIRISEFTNSTANQFYAALNILKAQGAKGLIVDLRQCPGGTLNSAVDLSGAFTGTGPAVFIRQSGGQESYLHTGNWPALGLPVAVLVNENTASAAELVAANVQDSQAGVVIGTQTYGKGVIQTVFTLPSGAGIVFTTGEYLSRGYQEIEKNRGVTPDIYVKEEAAQMQKAVEWLKIQKAAGSKLSLTMNSKLMWVHGNQVLLNQVPYIKAGSCYLPARQTLEALGCQLHLYDGILYISKGGLKISLDIKGRTYTQNGLEKAVALEQKEGAVFLPAAFYREVFQAVLTWNTQSQTLGVTLP